MTRHRPAPPPSSGLTTSWQHQATERLPDPALLIGSAGTVKSCNQAARLHFDLELTTRPYDELVAPESAEPLGAAVAGVLRGESPADTLLNYHTTAGFQPMESRFYPFTENSWVQSCIVIEYRRAQRQWLRGYYRERGYYGRRRPCPAPFGRSYRRLFSLDDEGRFSYLNVQAQRFLGKPRAELLGRRLLEVFEEFGVEGGHWLEALTSRAPGVFEQFYQAQRSWLEVHTYPTEAG